MLKGVKVGDKVVAFPYGIGTVVCIENDCIFNIQVEFKNPGGNTYTYIFSDEGKNVHWQDVIYCWTLNNAPSWIWENFERPMVTKPFEKWAVINSTGRIQKLFDTSEDMEIYVDRHSTAYRKAKITGEIEYEVEE